MSDSPSNSIESSLRVVKWIVIAFAVFTVMLTLVFFSWWTMKERFIFGDNAFDPVTWMAAAGKHDTCERGDMVLDVQRRMLQRGMDKSQVTVTLGRPTWEDHNQYEYELGKCLWIIHGLRLYFDDNGRLVHSAIIQH